MLCTSGLQIIFSNENAATLLPAILIIQGKMNYELTMPFIMWEFDSFGGSLRL